MQTNSATRLKALPASVAILAVTSALSTFPARAQEDTRSLNDRIERLERDIGTMQRQIYRGQYSGPVSAAPLDGSAALADQSRMDQIEEQQRQITGSLEQLQNGIAQMNRRLDRLSSDVDQRLTALDHGPGVGAGLDQGSLAPPRPATLDSQPRSPTASLNRGAIGGGYLAPPTSLYPSSGSVGLSGDTSPVPLSRGSADLSGGQVLPGGSVQEQYNSAFGLVRQAQYPEAEQALRTFVERNPKDPLAGNAQYWLAQSYYRQGDYTAAAQAFAEAYQRYPSGNKAPDTLVGLGQSLGRLGQKANACRTYARFDHEYATASGALKEQVRAERQKLACA